MAWHPGLAQVLERPTYHNCTGSRAMLGISCMLESAIAKPSVLHYGLEEMGVIGVKIVAAV